MPEPGASMRTITPLNAGDGPAREKGGGAAPWGRRRMVRSLAGSDVGQSAFGLEHFRLVKGTPPPAGEVEEDLFAGV